MHPLAIKFKNMAKNMANDLDIIVMYQKTNVICPCFYQIVINVMYERTKCNLSLSPHLAFANLQSIGF